MWSCQGRWRPRAHKCLPPTLSLPGLQGRVGWGLFLIRNGAIAGLLAAGGARNDRAGECRRYSAAARAAVEG